MKVWHAGLLGLGAALACGLAVWMTDLPPAAPARRQAAQSAPQDETSAKPAPAAAVPSTAVPSPAPAEQPSTPDVASAPPPVYSEPPHVMKPSPSPVPTAQPIRPPATNPPITPPAPVSPPAPYQEPPPVHRVPDPGPVRVTPPVAPQPERRATLDSGLGVSVRLSQPISIDRVQRGDVFQGVLADPLVANGFVVGERGAPVTGRVVDVQRGGITLRLLNFQSADGQRIEVSTEPWSVRNVPESTVIRFRLAARITVTERRL